MNQAIHVLTLALIGACGGGATLAADTHTTENGTTAGSYKLDTVPSLGPTVVVGFASGELATSLHPAVLEYVFATRTGPFRGYFEALLSSGSPAATSVTDAIKISGHSNPTAEHYARASARRMIGAVNKAIGAVKLPRGENEGEKGYASLTFTKRVDRKTGKLVDADLELILVVHEGARVLHVISGPNDPDYTWDLQYVPNAFDPDQPLDYETVVRRATPLHHEEDFQ